MLCVFRATRGNRLRPHLLGLCVCLESKVDLDSKVFSVRQWDFQRWVSGHVVTQFLWGGVDNFSYIWIHWRTFLFWESLRTWNSKARSGLSVSHHSAVRWMAVEKWGQNTSKGEEPDAIWIKEEKTPEIILLGKVGGSLGRPGQSVCSGHFLCQ